jgi:hypothetical protein
MATEYTIKTFSDIINGAMEHARQSSTDTTLIQRLKRTINVRYLKVQAYAKWKWRKEERYLYVPSFYAGTSCTITNGTKSLTVANVITEEVARDWVDRKIIISSDKEIYRIAALQSYASCNCVFILNQVYVSSTRTAVAFKVFQDEFAMDPDFSEFDDVVSFYQGKEVRRIGPDRIMQMFNAYPNRQGKAQYVTTVGAKTYPGVKLKHFVLGQNFPGGLVSAKRARIFPAISAEDYVLPITFVKKLQSLIEDDDKPIIPPDDVIILYYGAVADVYSYLKDPDETTRFEKHFEEKLTEMLVNNKEDDDRPRLQPSLNYRSRNQSMVSSYYEFDNSDFEMT